MLEKMLSKLKYSVSISTQRDFLISNGILNQFKMIYEKFKSNPHFVYDLHTRVNRLLEIDGMGTTYKTMILRNQTVPKQQNV